MDTQPISVLIVEDDPFMLDSAAEALESSGCTVVRANNHREAMESLDGGFLPTMVVTDINMPGGRSGLDLAREVEARWPDVRLLIVSGAERPSRDDYPERAVFFTKPYLPSSLVALATSRDW